jgi:nucleotide-binding universal stress UspA family protein
MKRILVALDASPRSRAVLATALSLASSAGAKERLFRAVPVQPEIPWDMIRQFPPGGLEELLAQHARADLDARARDVPPEQLDGVDIAIGTAWSAICAAARDYDADLIVIGSHGYGGVDRILGTTAGKVVNHADRSVLVVRGEG